MDFQMKLAVTRAEALALLREHWDITPQTEFVVLAQALGRVTAKPYYACHTLPVYRSSMVDGIAVRSADLTKGTPDTAHWLKGVHYVRADTGDDFPDAFDTLIPIESVDFDESGKLSFKDKFVLVAGSYVRHAGSQVKEGELLVQSGVRLGPLHLAALAMGGIYQIEVIKKPLVAYIPTGNELVPPGVKPERGQNIESNGLMVAAFLEQWGAETICYPIRQDKPAELELILEQALAAADLVLINGGSSKGEEDFNADLLQEKASFFRHGIKAIPGRPVGISIINEKPVINLPGPTIATLIAMDWCVYGLVHHYYGIKPPVRPTLKVKLGHSLKKMAGVEQYVWFVLSKAPDGYVATEVEANSSIPAKLLRPQAMFIAPLDATGYQADEEIEVELLCGTEELPK